MSDSQDSDPREMYAEITALMGGLSKAFGLDDNALITALESGQIGMLFDVDDNGNRYALATYEGKSARLYAGALKHSPDA